MSRSKYRFLKPGELLRKGDQYLDGNRWRSTAFEGAPVMRRRDYRRKVKVPKKPKPKKPAPTKLPTLHLHFEKSEHVLFKENFVSLQPWLALATNKPAMYTIRKDCDRYMVQWWHGNQADWLGARTSLPAAKALCTKHLNAMLKGMVKHNLAGKTKSAS